MTRLYMLIFIHKTIFYRIDRNQFEKLIMKYQSYKKLKKIEKNKLFSKIVLRDIQINKKIKLKF